MRREKIKGRAFSSDRAGKVGGGGAGERIESGQVQQRLRK